MIIASKFKYIDSDGAVKQYLLMGFENNMIQQELDKGDTVINQFHRLTGKYHVVDAVLLVMQTDKPTDIGFM